MTTIFRPLLLALVFGLPVQASAQEVRLPPEISAVPGQWFVVAPEIITGGKAKFRLDPGLQEVRLDILFPPEVANQSRGKVLQASSPGRYKIEAWNAKGDSPSDIATCWVTIVGTVPVIPPVVPPGPEPPVVPPTPVPVPIPSGPRTVLILRESAEDTPSQARLYTSLQAGKAHQELKAKGHSAFVLDDDAVNSQGQPPANVTAWKAALNLPLPAIAILDKDGKVLFKKTLSGVTLDTDVLNWVKEFGG